MAIVCPLDAKSCCDDLCHGSSLCLRTGAPVWERCWRCGHFVDPEDPECGCTEIEDDEPAGQETLHD